MYFLQNKKDFNLEREILNLSNLIEAGSNQPEIHFNLSLLLLLKGDFENGWYNYEYRMFCKDYNPPVPIRRFKQPLWRGEDLKGKSIFIYEEQGIGDTFQFSRYILYLKQFFNVKNVIFGCRSKIVDIFHGEESGWQGAIDKLLFPGDKFPIFDTYSSLLSLPYIFSKSSINIPHKSPYLKAKKKLIDFYKIKIAELFSSDVYKVGICWQGNNKNINDVDRSITLNYFESLFGLENIKFFSLQKGFGEEQIRKFGYEELIIDWSENLDFTNTAALIENLDLVITIDTSIAHLSGAMGKQTWVLLPLIPDFRWMLNSEDSFWYPSMKLYRQVKSNEWESVVYRLEKSLKSISKN